MFLKELLLGFSLFCFFAFACNENSTGDKRGKSWQPEDGKVIVLAHQHTLVSDEVNLYAGKIDGNKPVGLVLHTALNLKLSQQWFGAWDLEELDRFFETRDYLLPVLMLSIDRTQFNAVCEGKFDESIQRLSAFISSLDRPAYLAIGYEVNNPLFQISPESGKQAFRCMVDKIQAAGTNNLSYVWYINGMNPSYQNFDLMEWYPGDAYVNWIGTSIYKLTPAHYSEDATFSSPNYQRLLEIADEKDLPIMILESSTYAVEKNLALSGQALWESWYVPFFDFVKNKRVKAFAHLNHKWEDSIIKSRYLEEIEDGNYLFANDHAIDLGL